MGGHVASETAIIAPDRVAALVLLDASGLPGGPGYPLAVRMAGWPVIGPVLRSLPGRGRVRDRLHNAVYDPQQITEADVDAYYAPLRSAGGTNAFFARMRQPVTEERLARDQIAQATSTIRNVGGPGCHIPYVARLTASARSGPLHWWSPATPIT